jgi:tryptophan synthase beta chain
MADTLAAPTAAPAATTDRFGPFGGRYVPETLIPALDELEAAFGAAMADAAFRRELDDLLRTYVGRPSPLSARRGSPRWWARRCG